MLKQLRECIIKLKEELRTIIDSGLISDFKYSSKIHNKTGQYWALELFMYNPDEEWLDPISINVGYFSSLGGHLNTPIDINKFYRNNDEIVTEFFHCGEMHNFGNLTEAIIDIENISPLNYNASVTVNSFVISSNEWLRSICEETLLILHPDENFSNELYIGVQQSERKFIKVKEKTKVMTYKIPFDKIDHFANFELVEDVHSNISHNYQIALSFAGEDRKYVNEVAKELKDMGIRVFYDDYEKASLWGKRFIYAS